MKWIRLDLVQKRHSINPSCIISLMAMYIFKVLELHSFRPKGAALSKALLVQLRLLHAHLYASHSCLQSQQR